MLLKNFHLREWKESEVNPLIIHYNLQSLAGDLSYNFLFHSLPHSERRNTGQLRSYWLNNYAHIEAGGWWCSGIDLVTLNDSDWGCFKPDTPRCNAQGKVIKYEHPPKTPTGVFALRVPEYLAQTILHPNPSFQADPDPCLTTDTAEARGMWSRIKTDPAIPLTITEGAKKTACVLSAGHACLGLPGVYNGVRTPKNQYGDKIGKPTLIPELECIDWQGRKVTFLYDQDTKRKTVRNVRKAIQRLGYQLARRGAEVRVASWHNQYKGVDDLVAACGQQALARAISLAEPLATYNLKEYTDLDRYVTHRVHQQYLADRRGEAIANPLGLGGFPPALKGTPSDKRPVQEHGITIEADVQLIGLKSAKGTGKTEYIRQLIAKDLASGKGVLGLTYRIQLGVISAARLGLDYISDIHTSPQRGALGYFLCVDSLHPKSQAKFDPQQWTGATVILDEVEQILHHLLNSATCRKYRTIILENLKQLLRLVVATGGKIIIADADLSAIAYRHITEWIGTPVKTAIIENSWQPEAKDCTVYGSNAQLLANLCHNLDAGARVMVHTSSQQATSSYGSLNLENILQEKYPQRSILRIDAESIADPNHPAYGCMGKINDILPHYDIVIASPAIETGTSIDIKHFDSVWGFFGGIQTVNSVVQTLARVRDGVPRHVYLAPRGRQKIAGGSCNPWQILNSTKQHARTILQLLGDGYNPETDLTGEFQPESLKSWAISAAVTNAQNLTYRESVLRQLALDGYDCQFYTEPDPDDKLVKEMVQISKQELIESENQQTLEAPSPSNSEYETLQNKRAKTATQRATERKGTLERMYQVPVTDELIALHRDGIYPKLRLHYYMSLGREQVLERDRAAVDAAKEAGAGNLYFPDLTSNTYISKVTALEILDIGQVMREHELYSNDNLREWAERVLRYRSGIKDILGVSVTEKMSPIQIAKKLLSVMGLNLTYKCYQGSARKQEKRVRLYEFTPPQDHRGEIFAAWNATAEK
jgi:hypothetical protein